MDSAADASALAALAADATGAAVPPVDVAASAAASDYTAPANDSRASTVPLIDAAEGTVPLVAGFAANVSAHAAATADDAGAPQLMQRSSVAAVAAPSTGRTSASPSGSIGATPQRPSPR